VRGKEGEAEGMEGKGEGGEEGGGRGGQSERKKAGGKSRG